MTYNNLYYCLNQILKVQGGAHMRIISDSKKIAIINLAKRRLISDIQDDLCTPWLNYWLDESQNERNALAQAKFDKKELKRKDKLAEVETEKNGLVQAKAVLNTNKSRLETEKSRLERLVTPLVTSINRINSEKNKLQNEIDSLRIKAIQLSESNARYNSLMTQIDNKLQQINQLRSPYDDETKKRALETEIDQCDFNIQAVTRQIHDKDAEITVKDNAIKRLTNPNRLDDIKNKYIELYSERFFRSSHPDDPIMQKYGDWIDKKTIIENIINAQINKFEPEYLLNQLFEQYPWLAYPSSYDYAEEHTIIIDFLTTTLEDQLLKRISSYALGNNDWSRLPIPEVQKLVWQSIDDNFVKETISGHPYSDIQEFYLNNSEYTNVLSRRHNWENGHLTRVDLTRFIQSFDSNALSVTKKMGIAHMRMAPINTDDLNKLTPAQINSFQTIFLNLGEEDAPQWILLNKHNHNWTAYLKNAEQENLYNSAALPISPNFVTVDYQENVKVNDLDLRQPQDEVEWQTILLARVFPWCQTNQIKPLNEYRATIPLPYLMEQALQHAFKTNANVNDNLKNIFFRRKPLSEQEFAHNDLFTKPEFKEKYNLLAFIDPLDGKFILDAFDNNLININANNKQVSLQNRVELKHFHAALSMFYYHGAQLSRLNFDAIPTYITEADKPLIQHDLNVMAYIFPEPLLRTLGDKAKNIAFPWKYGARNRFYRDFGLNVDKHTDLRVFTDTKLANDAFIYLARTNFSDEFIHAAIEFRKKWTYKSFDYTTSSPAEAAGTAFTQLAQLGAEHLSYFFTAISERIYSKNFKPLEHYVVDLDGSLVETPEYHTSVLNKIISDFPEKLFCKKWSLLIPETINDKFITQLGKLLTTIDARFKTNVNDVSEINLYNLPCEASSLKLIQSLIEVAKANKLTLLVHVPDWNKNPLLQQSEIKAAYRDLQNVILDNRRSELNKKLTQATRSIYLVAEGKLVTDINIDAKLEQRQQIFEGEDAFYPLDNITPGLQQQQQQEQQQQLQNQVQEDVVQETILEKENDIALLAYGQDESGLIHRGNINQQDKLKSFWAHQDSTIKSHASTDETDDLAALFSLWVGSDVDAKQIIHFMEPAAVEKIMQHANRFRLGFGWGLTKNNLPPGFYLAKSSEEKLILCFSSVREKQDLLEHQNNPNLFRTILHTPKPSQEFHGDYFQFKPFSNHDELKTPEFLQTLWHFLAENEPVQLAAAHRVLAQENDNALLEVLSLERSGNSALVDDYEQILNKLTLWANATGKCSPDLCNLIFASESDVVFTLDNLKAFGQLFYEADAVTPEGDKAARATEHWLFIAEKVRQAFGSEHFKRWMTYVVSPSKNWYEILDKKEVDAVADSIITLSEPDAKEYADIWWALIEANGQATGHMRYSQLWSAFKTVIELINRRRLNIDIDILNDYFEQNPNFDATVFLNKLYALLRDAEEEVDAKDIQQTILSNIHLIDFTSSGYEYAKREGYRFWDQSLELTKFKSVIKTDSPTYQVHWNHNVELEENVSPISFVLRFATQVLTISKTNFNQLKTILAPFDTTENIENNLAAFRLLTACIGLGFDEIDQINNLEASLESLNQSNPEVLSWLNQVISLNPPLLAGTLRLRWEDIPTFAHFFTDNPGLFAQLRHYSGTKALDIINNLGQGLAYLRNETDHVDKNKFISDLLQHNLSFQADPNWENWLAINIPWLLTEPECATQTVVEQQDTVNTIFSRFFTHTNEFKFFVQQLNSINFETSTQLPHIDELVQAFNSIATPAERRAVVTELVQRGCDITLQDTLFRKLNDEEKKVIRDKATPTIFKGIYAPLNTNLWNTFLTKYIAIESDKGEWEQQTNALKSLLQQLDNKYYYNEVGQILGLLINKAKTNQPHFIYSAPQITKWIGLFLDRDKLLNDHYPVGFLSEVIDSELAQPSPSLLNNALGKLESTGRFEAMRVNNSAILQSILPDKYKQLLLKANLIHDYDDIYGKIIQLESLYHVNDNLDWLNAIAEFLPNQVQDGAEYIWSLITDSLGEPDLDAELWQASQIKFIGLLSQFPTAQAAAFEFENPRSLSAENKLKESYLRVILANAFEQNPKQFASDRSNPDLFAQSTLNFNLNKFKHLKPKLKRLAPNELKQLAQYYAHDPRPSFEVLDSLLTNSDAKKAFTTASEIIHHYETVIQATDSKGNSLRTYSFSEQDKSDLKRVLSGFSLKGEGGIDQKEVSKLTSLLAYANNYCQREKLATCSMEELQKKLNDKLMHAKSHPKSNTSKTAVVACLREIILRKTGKWANHTQMIDLIYGARHSGTSLMHQMRTGEGKSIITIARTAYLALEGKTVVSFSAKESLSKRDHEEFCSVLDALEIDHNYIEANSPKDALKIKSKNGRGTVNYATKGNFDLFMLARSWKNEEIELIKANTVAFVDEMDDILDDKSQHRYSSGKDQGVYNLDEWVLYAGHQFYEEHSPEFKKAEEGILILSRNKDLKNFCSVLQKYYAALPQHALNQNGFFEKYLAPIVSLNEQLQLAKANEDDIEIEHLTQEFAKAIKLRDDKLMSILVATHCARHLSEGVNFCNRVISKKINNNLSIDVRFSKVMIDNQIIEGSAYSEGVQDSLHALNNINAAKMGDAPNYFIDPESTVALSSNTSYMFDPKKGMFGQLEGCTGTAGDSNDRKIFRDKFHVKQVIKLPTHQVRKTNYLLPQYEESEAHQVSAIAKALVEHNAQPTLVTCEDDNEVKRLGNAVKAYLIENHPDYKFDNFVIDTNESGKSEQDIIPHAGRKGAVTFSARMNRGTDIKPDADVIDKGLLVVRTYVAKNKRLEKQEEGRQGRNGAVGVSVDIIDFSKVFQKHEFFMASSTFREQYQDVFAKQRMRFNHKLQKTVKPGTKNYREREVLREPYEITSAVQQFQRELQQTSDSFVRSKEDLVANLTGEIQSVLKTQCSTKEQRDLLLENWLVCLKEIENAWTTRLKGHTHDSLEIYQEFVGNACIAWNTLDDAVDVEINDFEQVIAHNEPVNFTTTLKAVPITDASGLEEAITFYQRWTEGASTHHFNGKNNDEKIETIYGANTYRFNEFFKELHKSSRSVVLNNPTQLYFSLLTESVFGQERWRANEARNLLESQKFQQRLAHVNERMEVIDHDNEDIIFNDVKIKQLFIDVLTHSSIQGDNYVLTEGITLDLTGTPLFQQEFQVINRAIVSILTETLGENFELINQADYSIYLKECRKNQFPVLLSQQQFESLKDNPNLSKEALEQALITDAKPLFIKNMLEAEFYNEKFPLHNEMQGLYQQFFNHLINSDSLKAITESFTEVRNKPPAPLVSKSAFALSCASWTRLLKRFDALESTYAESNVVLYHKALDNYANYLESFFAINLFKKKDGSEKTVEDLSLKELNQVQLLFKLILNVLPGHLRENHTSPHFLDYDSGFVKKLSDLMLRYRPDFDAREIHLLIRFFTQNEFATQFLFSDKVSPKDLAYLIKLVIDERKSPSKLFEYIETYHKELNENPNILRPLIELLLVDEQDYVPAPNLLHDQEGYQFEQEELERFWTFLAERPGFTDKECNDLLEELNVQYNRGNPKPILKELFKTPAHLPLAYINRYMDLNVSTNNAQAISKIKTLRSVGNVFNSFLEDMGLVDSRAANPITNPDVVKIWETLLIDRPVNMTEKTLLIHLEALSMLKKRIINLIPSDAKKILLESFEEKINQGLYSEESYKQLEQFTNWVANQKDSASLTKAAKGFLDSNAEGIKPDHILEIITSLKTIKNQQFVDRMFTDYMDDYSDVEQEIIHDKWIKFINILAPHAANLSLTNYRSLHQQFIKDKSLNETWLKETLKTLNDVEDYLKLETKGRVAKFNNDVQFRSNVMRCLFHDLVTLPNDQAVSNDTWERHYWNMAERIGVNSQKAPTQIRANRTENYAQLLNFTQEIAHIVNIPENSHLNKKLDISNNYRQFFREKEKEYSAVWFKNSDRKNQAKTLFSALSTSSALDYGKVLKLIQTTQHNIVESDRETKRNKKGHSRLLDISSDMFLRVASDWMKDESLSVGDKEPLNRMLSKELTYHLNILLARLKEDEKRMPQQKLVEQCLASDTSTEIQTILQSKAFDRLPKHLHYIVDHARNLSGMSKEALTITIERKSFGG